MQLAGFVRETQTAAVAATSTTLRYDLPSCTHSPSPITTDVASCPPLRRCAGVWRGEAWQRRRGGGERGDCDVRAG